MEEHPRRTSSLAELLRVMAHPVRLMILEELSHGMKCVNDMRDLLKLPQPNVSQHLALLKKRGLILSHKDGSSRCYHLAQPGLVKDLLAWLSRYRAAINLETPEKSGGARRDRASSGAKRGPATTSRVSRHARSKRLQGRV
jgi:ArsR family transcriptional regulator